MVVVQVTSELHFAARIRRGDLGHTCRTYLVGLLVSEMIGRHYEDEGETRLKELVAWLEPLMIVGLGVVVAVVVLSVMLPMFDIATLAQKSG